MQFCSLNPGINAELLIKATKVDGVYSDDPKINPDAVLYETLSFEQVLAQDLKVMDHAAASLCRENNIPVIVLNIFKNGVITKAINGEKVGTLIRRK